MKKILAFTFAFLFLGIAFSYANTDTENMFSDLPNVEICGVGYVYDNNVGDCVEDGLDRTIGYDCVTAIYYCPIGEELLFCPAEGEQEVCTQKNTDDLLEKIEALKKQLEELLASLVN